MGSLNEFTREMYEKVIRLGMEGSTEARLATELGVTLETIREWRTGNEVFIECLNNGKQLADQTVQNALYKRATGFTGPDEVYYPPDAQACIIWLANRKPNSWGKIEVEQIHTPDRH